MMNAHAKYTGAEMNNVYLKPMFLCNSAFTGTRPVLKPYTHNRMTNNNNNNAPDDAEK
jgi:hypothetical protein